MKWLVHLGENHAAARRDRTSARAYPIGEADRPTRGQGTPEEQIRRQIEIVRYLDVENSPRYQPEEGRTFCNVYACDYCYLNGVYLPRVWWMAQAIAELLAGKSVPVKYGQTVRELNANALYEWLHQFGPSFGWRRIASLDELQQAANQGGVGLICAQRTDLGRPGHIAVVIPEDAPPLAARRSSGKILLPLQSQAGTKNFCFSCGTGTWWASAQFRAYGFWMHA